ncbi:glutathione reductase [Levilactobacillus paucivorans]|uniref:Glutathione reductase n=1 Tax=Levilactobacillus paucivorans TaxID=616990 RepID=A0A0R2LQD5_9LACO|nr:NAD(P)/FAD-dependent oxidoreductase [Levilactobacillus paucivorans]KRO03479.1 glutathione reductase [Levilactobacillus paucivorans]
MKTFDTIVIGGGVGGAGAAIRAASHGQKVAIVEQRDWGGTTVSRGSTPKKVLLGGIEAHRAFRIQNGSDGVPPVNWERLAAHRDTIVSQTQERFKRRFVANNIVTFEGHAEFVDSHQLRVNGEYLTAKNFVIATGARPRELKFSGSQWAEHSGGFFKRHKTPRNITILGAGVIAFAIAGIASEAGATVTLVQHNHVALRGFDPQLVQKLISHLAKQKVRVVFDDEVVCLDRESKSLKLTTKQGKTWDTEAVYAALGRVPNVADLNLKAAGVKVVTHGIQVNDYLQTSNAKIFAVGDCSAVSTPKLANYAVYQGKYVGDLLTATLKFPITYPIQASAVFSLPRLAQFGVSAAVARQDAEHYRLREMDLSQWLTYQREYDEQAQLILVVDRQSGQVVGAEAISYQADVLINYLALLIQQQITPTQLHDTLFAYPSAAADLYGIWTD